MKKCQHVVRCLTFFILSILWHIGEVLLCFYFYILFTLNTYFIRVVHVFDIMSYFKQTTYVLNRVEPLICKEYDNRRPVIIPYHRGGKRLYVGYQVSLSIFLLKCRCCACLFVLI